MARFPGQRGEIEAGKREREAKSIDGEIEEIIETRFEAPEDR